MRKRHPKSSDVSEPSGSQRIDNDVLDKEVKADVRRSGKVWISLLILISYFSWAVYKYQHANLPHPLTAQQAGKRGFSEIEAMKHVSALTQFGPRPVSSDALDLALQVSETDFSQWGFSILSISNHFVLFIFAVCLGSS